MLNAYATTGLENYAVGSNKTFMFQGNLNGILWNINGGTGFVLLVDPSGLQHQLVATIANNTATANWVMATPSGQWVYTWHITDQNGLTKVSLPLAFGVIDITQPAQAFPPFSPPPSPPTLVPVIVEQISPLVREPRGNKITTVVPITSTTPVQLLGSNPNRIDVTFFNAGGATVFLGGPGLTPPEGIGVPGSGLLSDDGSLDPWYAYVVTGSATVTIVETS
jgi:hypothetical protein